MNCDRMIGDGMGLRILVADDEKLAARLLAECLEDEGFPGVAIVFLPEDALAHIEEHKPDLVYLDVSFNVAMTGIDVLRRIRQTAPETSVCMMTGFRDDCRAEVDALGVFAFIGKPATMESFVEVAKSLARQRGVGRH